MLSYCRGRVCLEVAVAMGRELLSPLSPQLIGLQENNERKGEQGNSRKVGYMLAERQLRLKVALRASIRANSWFWVVL